VRNNKASFHIDHSQTHSTFQLRRLGELGEMEVGRNKNRKNSRSGQANLPSLGKAS
jgi:hypothetical protein